MNTCHGGKNKRMNRPAINFIKDPFHASIAMVMLEVLRYPIDEVILIDSFDHLME
jgi:hypothetical protein